jgi:hypothetical protein
MSLKESLERKKYMAVWRWESELTARKMSRLPSTGTRYMDRNTLKISGCNSGSSVSPRRRNFVRAVWFLGSMF